MCGSELANYDTTTNSSSGKSNLDRETSEATSKSAIQGLPVKLDSSFVGVETSAQWALASARNLLAVNRIVFFLGMASAILLIAFSFIPVCPPFGDGCYGSSEGLYNFVSLFPLGLGTLLSVLWLNGIADTIATRAALAAEVAKAQGK
jgi:hypothetical protein